MIYLVRHTTPVIPKSICYGHTDMGLAPSFVLEASHVLQQLPPAVHRIFSSPLQRCQLLAKYLAAVFQCPMETDSSLKELNFGQWEMKSWDAIPEPELNAWMNDYVKQAPPGGESFLQLHERVTHWWKNVQPLQDGTIIVTHGGVIRSLLSHLHQTPLQEAFSRYPLPFGAVIRI